MDTRSGDILMNQTFVIDVFSNLDNKKSKIILKDYDDVVKLVQNMDSERYRLGVVVNINEPVFFDISAFVKQSNDLEIGN